jgi:hypothetical protein
MTEQVSVSMATPTGYYIGDPPPGETFPWATVQAGWQCPVCRHVMSPVMTICPFCPATATTMTATGASPDPFTIRLPDEMGGSAPVQIRRDIGSDWSEVFPGLQARWIGFKGDGGGVTAEWRVTPQTCPGGC